MSIVKSVGLDVKISRGWRTCLPWRLWRSVLLSLPFYISTYIAIYLAILFPLSSICLHPIYCIFFFFTFTFTFATRPDRLANYDLYLTDLSAPSNLTWTIWPIVSNLPALCDLSLSDLSIYLTWPECSDLLVRPDQLDLTGVPTWSTWPQTDLKLTSLVYL